jgi:hypothetical protein
MTIPIYLNLVLYCIVIYCIIIRTNMLQGPRQWTHRISLTCIAIGACWQGFEPLVTSVPVYWGDLFLPAGLALFFYRYVHKVERFFLAGLQ